MYHQSIVLIIGISLCCILHEISAITCPQNEIPAFIAPLNLPTCKNKGMSGKWVFGDQCICAKEWLVRNDKGECVPVWTCPDICPPNKEFTHCGTGFRPTDEFHGLTAIRLLEKCQPVCYCKEDYVWVSEQQQCLRSRFRNKFLGQRG